MSPRSHEPRLCVGLLAGAAPAVADLTALKRALGRHRRVTPVALHDVDLARMDVVVVDLRTARASDIVDLRATYPALALVALVAPDDAQLALESVRAGASDYVATDADPSTLGRGVDRAVARARRVAAAAGPGVASPLVGTSPDLATIRAQIRLVASVDAATVLITGESGAGKDVVATEIHAAGTRRDRPFMAIDCASIPETLLESHLFGHERGAFTDARQLKRGLFELAHGGTIFLDEIGELPPGTQAKLLRALESRRFRRVGGAQDLPLDAAVIAATNRDLLAESRDGRFRPDLYYRLNVVRIHVPPLREHPQDIPVLAAHFVARFNGRLGRAYDGVDPFALRALQDYAWPGNVRELRNAIERAMILNPDEEVIRVCDLPPEVVDELTSSASARGPFDEHGRDPTDLRDLPNDGIDLVALERGLVAAAMRRTRGNQTRAAALLRISRFALKTRLERHGLTDLAHRRRGRPPNDGAPDDGKRR